MTKKGLCFLSQVQFLGYFCFWYYAYRNTLNFKSNNTDILLFPCMVSGFTFFLYLYLSHHMIRGQAKPFLPI